MSREKAERYYAAHGLGPDGEPLPDTAFVVGAPNGGPGFHMDTHAPNGPPMHIDHHGHGIDGPPLHDPNFHHMPGPGHPEHHGYGYPYLPPGYEYGAPAPPPSAFGAPPSYHSAEGFRSLNQQSEQNQPNQPIQQNVSQNNSNVTPASELIM